MTDGTLWVFGDSYSTPGLCVEPCDSYWGLASKYLSTNSIRNCSRSSNSWRSVQHLLISMQEEYNWKNDFFLIGIPPLERITVFDDHKDTRYIGKLISNTWEEKEFDILCHRGLISYQNYGDDRKLIIFSDRAWVETDLLNDIFLMTAWLDSKGANYLIVNHSKPLDSGNVWGPTTYLLPFAKNHPRCILFENTYHSVNVGVVQPADHKIYGEFGHHGAEGNRRFFELSVKSKLQQLGH